MTPAGRLLLWRATAVPDDAGAAPGTLVPTASGLLGIATGGGILLPTEVQPDNRRAMPWPAFLHGSRLTAGMQCTEMS